MDHQTYLKLKKALIQESREATCKRLRTLKIF